MSFGQVLSMGEANLPAAQLALCGVDDIDLMIVTHTHIDHIGGLFIRCAHRDLSLTSARCLSRSIGREVSRGIGPIAIGA